MGSNCDIRLSRSAGTTCITREKKLIHTANNRLAETSVIHPLIQPPLAWS